MEETTDDTMDETMEENTVKCIIPEDPFSDERTATGMGEGIDARAMLQSHQWLPFSSLFKAPELEAEMNEKQKEFFRGLVPEARNKGMNAKVFSIHLDYCIDPCDTTYENVRRFGLNNNTQKTQEYRAFLMCLNLAARVLQSGRGNTPVNAEEAFRESTTAVNTNCPRHAGMNCYCAEGQESRDLLRACLQDSLPLPFQANEDGEGYCYRLPDVDNYDNLPAPFQEFDDPEAFNDLSVEEQRAMATEGFSFQPFPSFGGGEEQPKVLLEFIRRKGAVEDEDSVVALRFFYLYPNSNQSNDFGDEILRMLEENAKCTKKDQSGFYRMDRTLKNRSDFMEAVDLVMYHEHDLHSNSLKNQDPNLRDILKSDELFREKIKTVLDFKLDMHKIQRSIHAKDDRVKNFKETLMPDSEDYPFVLSNYFLEDGETFCPRMCVQENMVDLDYSLLQKVEGVPVLLEKYNLPYYIVQKEKYDRKHARESSKIVAEPTPLSVNESGTDKLRHNPCNDEFRSVLNMALKDYSGDDAETVKGTVKIWTKNMDGAALNCLRHEQSSEQVAYLEEGKKNKTNAEARAHFRKWVHRSCVETKRASRRKDNFNSARGAFDMPLILAGRQEDNLYTHPPWNPWHLGVRKQVAPNLGVGDMFIAELFKVMETLFFVSTHMGILLFCWICGGDAFTTRRDKCNFLFVGGPDGGKSHAMNVCKKHMLIPSTYMMKTKQSDTAMDDVSVMYMREWREEEDLEYFLKNSKFSVKQDIEKNRLTAALLYKLVRKQFKDKHDCQKWVTKMVITIFSAQTGSSTNETQLSKFIPSMLSRKPAVYIPKTQRKDGNRSVSAMVSAQSQRSESNKRQESRYDAKCIYYDALRFLMTIQLNQGVLPGPTRKVFNLIMDKLKEKFKLNTRTELRTYGKAVQFMFIRIIETLFNHPKPNTELAIGLATVSNMDPWSMKDEKFQQIFVSKEGLELLKRKDDCLVTLVDAEGRPIDCKRQLVPSNAEAPTYRLKINEEKLLDKKGNPCCFARTFQRYPDGSFVGAVKEDPDELPDTCMGEFYRQFVSIKHENYERFVRFICPMLTITVEDTVRAIWLTRPEINPDRFAVFERHVCYIGEQKLKNPDIRVLGERSKRDNCFYKIQENSNGDSEISVNRNYVKLGTVSQTIAMIMNCKNTGDDANAYPAGHDVQADYGTLREMLIALTEKKDNLGHFHLGPSFITKGGTPYWGELRLASGTPPSFDFNSSLMPLGRENLGAAVDGCLPAKDQKWSAYESNGGELPVQDEDQKREAMRVLYAKYQHLYPEGTGECMANGEPVPLQPNMRRVVSVEHKQPILLIKNAGMGVKDSSVCYLSINFIKEHWPNRNTPLEELNPLKHCMADILGYKHDGIKISREESERLQRIATKEAETAESEETSVEEKEWIQEELRATIARLEGLVAGPDEVVGKTILLGSPYMGTAKGKKSSFDNTLFHKRVCQPQTSSALHYFHKEKAFRTESANVPSKNTVEMLGLDPNDGLQQSFEIDVPMNDLGNLARLHKLYELPEGVTVNDYRALLDDGMFQFSSANAINETMHSGLKADDYMFPKEEKVQYPDNGAMEEDFSFTHRKVQEFRTTADKKIVKGWSWVPFKNTKRRKHRELSEQMKASMSQRRTSRQRVQLV
jgi:hypothetical protein